ncbi:MAG TPA: M23 family metallopeptidase [Kofleriaceae bacterium]|jgi:murein DD-endopeptidase MepM/ murein hydrolase activator NlpD
MKRPAVSLALASVILPLISTSAIAAPAAPSADAESFVRPEVFITNLANVVTKAYAARQAARQVASQAAAPLSLPSAIFGDIAAVLEPMLPADALDELVRWRCEVRDALHATDVSATERLAFTDLAATKFKLPDLSVLTRFPLPQSERSWQTSGFGWRDDPYRHRSKFHAGADIRAESGTPVFAAGDGVVSFAGRMNGYGNLVMVDHGGGVITRYAHLRAILTKKGSVLAAGTTLGLVGRTGHATGNHLHFEVRLDDRPVSPTLALTVGEMQRDQDPQADFAAFGLDPDRQMHAMSDLDPPKSRKEAAKSKLTGSRPERRGRGKRVRPTS